MSTRLENLSKLNDISNFKKGWNGEDSDPISDTILVQVKNFLENVLWQPEIFPTAANSMQLEYELTNGNYLEFDITEDRITCMYVPGHHFSEATIESYDTLDMDTFNQIVERFYFQET